MNATTVNQFAQRCATLAVAIDAAKPRKAEKEVAARLAKLAAWLRAQGEARRALHMRVSDFMARCPASVRDAARELFISALDTRVKQDARASQMPAPKTLRKRKISAKRQVQLDAQYAAEQAEAEKLARMSEGEAAAYLRETI